MTTHLKTYIIEKTKHAGYPDEQTDRWFRATGDTPEAAAASVGLNAAAPNVVAHEIPADFATNDEGTAATLWLPEPPSRTVECIYCSAMIQDPGEDQPPAVTDAGAWAALAQQHAPDCEWIITRAHRLTEDQ